jgi:hypothetical protein
MSGMSGNIQTRGGGGGGGQGGSGVAHTGSPLAAMLAMSGARGGAAGGDLNSSQAVVTQMARMLGDERAAMQIQAKMLRIREMDLLLREKAVEVQLQPPAHGLIVPTLPGSSSVTSPRPPSSFSSAVNGGGGGPPMTARRASRKDSYFAGVQPAAGGGGSRNSTTAAHHHYHHHHQHGPSHGYHQPPSAPKIVLEPEQLDGIIHNPAKLPLLFQRIDPLGTGRISDVEFMELYRNSPCLWKVGVPDHEKVVNKMLPTIGITAEIFGLLVLQLIR